MTDHFSAHTATFDICIRNIKNDLLHGGVIVTEFQLSGFTHIDRMNFCDCGLLGCDMV